MNSLFAVDTKDSFFGFIFDLTAFSERITFRAEVGEAAGVAPLRGSPRGWALGTRLERQVEYRGEFGAVEANLHKSNWSCSQPREGP